jgi:hypothetical protein
MKSNPKQSMLKDRTEKNQFKKEDKKERLRST